MKTILKIILSSLTLFCVLNRRSIKIPLIFYVGVLGYSKPKPLGCFTITNQPDEVLHSIFDVLERRSNEIS